MAKLGFKLTALRLREGNLYGLSISQGVQKRISVRLREEALDRLMWIKDYCRSSGEVPSNSLIVSAALTIYKWYLSSLLKPRPACPGCERAVEAGPPSCPNCGLKLKWMAAMEPSAHQ